MPIYEYICLDCKKEYEILRSFNEADEPIDCDECGSENVKRKLSLLSPIAVARLSAGWGAGERL